VAVAVARPQVNLDEDGEMFDVSFTVLQFKVLQFKVLQFDNFPALTAVQFTVLQV
jgi:hypothetical protein